MIAFVDPPHACKVRIAFLNAPGVMIEDGVRFSLTISTIALPELKAATKRAGSFSGITEVPGSDIPSASTMSATEEAVPIVLHAPRPQFRQLSNSFHSFSEIFFAR